MYKFTYSIQNTDSIFAQDIPSRSMAREELRNIKASGYKGAKIVRTEWIVVNSKQVR